MVLLQKLIYLFIWEYVADKYSQLYMFSTV